VAALAKRGFDTTAGNVLALDEIVKEAIEVDWKAVEVQVTDERPVESPDIGNVFASGTILRTN
jgi:hypothetical protein